MLCRCRGGRSGRISENIGAALERSDRLFGDREAVVDGGLRLSYRELRHRVAAFDASLDALGLAAGDVVAVLALNSAAHLVSWLAIPRSGRVLNDLNVRLAPAELEFIVNDSGARALIVDDVFLELGRKLADACEMVEHLIYAGAGAAPDGCLLFAELCEVAGGPPATVDPDAVAGIFYTGGTTGLPKGAMLTHRNLVANAKHVLILFHYDETDSYATGTARRRPPPRSARTAGITPATPPTKTTTGTSSSSTASRT